MMAWPTKRALHAGPAGARAAAVGYKLLLTFERPAAAVLLGVPLFPLLNYYIDIYIGMCGVLYVLPS